jgi:hypothetical protein
MRAILRYLRCHHIGIAALFIALSGTAYAATLPRNSVGTQQLKRNAVTSSKVKNASLRAVDFRRGQLPAGPQGPKGDTGAQGDPGPKGDFGARGSTGPRGPSDAFAGSAEPIVKAPLDPPFALVSLALPGGAFVVEANMVVDGTNSVTGISCGLGPPGFPAAGEEVDAVDFALASSTDQSVTLFGMLELDGPGTVSLECDLSAATGSGTLTFDDIDIGAIQTGALHET